MERRNLDFKEPPGAPTNGLAEQLEHLAETCPPFYQFLQLNLRTPPGRLPLQLHFSKTSVGDSNLLAYHGVAFIAASDFPGSRPSGRDPRVAFVPREDGYSQCFLSGYGLGLDRRSDWLRAVVDLRSHSPSANLTAMINSLEMILYHGPTRRPLSICLRLFRIDNDLGLRIEQKEGWECEVIYPSPDRRSKRRSNGRHLFDLRSATANGYKSDRVALLSPGPLITAPFSGYRNGRGLKLAIPLDMILLRDDPRVVSSQ